MTPRRLLSGEDMGWVLDLLHRAFAGMEGRIDPPSSLHQLTLDDIAAQAEQGEVWVIGRNACVFLSPRADHCPSELYIGKLAVDPDWQGKGLARMLLELAEQRAHTLGLERLVLQTRVELLENHRVFARLGFEKVAENCHPGFDRPTSYRFEKEVRA